MRNHKGDLESLTVPDLMARLNKAEGALWAISEFMDLLDGGDDDAEVLCEIADVAKQYSDHNYHEVKSDVKG